MACSALAGPGGSSSCGRVPQPRAGGGSLVWGCWGSCRCCGGLRRRRSPAAAAPPMPAEQHGAWWEQQQQGSQAAGPTSSVCWRQQWQCSSSSGGARGRQGRRQESQSWWAKAGPGYVVQCCALGAAALGCCWSYSRAWQRVLCWQWRSSNSGRSPGQSTEACRRGCCWGWWWPVCWPQQDAHVTCGKSRRHRQGQSEQWRPPCCCGSAALRELLHPA